MAWLPLPGSIPESIQRGVQTGGGLMQALLQGAQGQAELGQAHQHHLDNYQIHRMQQERLAALMPYEMQKIIQELESYPINQEYKKALTQQAWNSAQRANFQTQKESPEERAAREIATFREKENIRNENRAGKGENNLSTPIRATIAQNQSIIAASNNIIPQLKQLKSFDIPNQVANISPNKQQAYLGLSNSIADGLMTAFSLPRTDQSLHMVKQMVQRGKYETEGAYKDRLDILIDELNQRQKNANQILTESHVAPKEHSNNEEMGSGQGSGAKRIKYNVQNGKIE
jgi:hypothetical protein